jgi:hypothetical protein
MTKLGAESSVSRETQSIHRGRPLVAELRGRYLMLRPKGTRRSVTIRYDEAYEHALYRDAKLAARASGVKQ